jgi:hypothetical protein
VLTKTARSTVKKNLHIPDDSVGSAAWGRTSSRKSLRKSTIALRNHLSQASQAEAERHSALQATLLAGSLYPPGPLEHGQQQPEHTSQYPLPAPEQQQGDVSQNDMSMQENDGGPGSGGDYPMEDTPVRRGGKGGTKILSDSKRAQQNRAAQVGSSSPLTEPLTTNEPYPASVPATQR